MNRSTESIFVNTLLFLINLGVSGYSGYMLYEEHTYNNNSWKNCDKILIYSAASGIATMIYGLYRVYETIYSIHKRRALRNRLHEPRKYCRGGNVLILFALYVAYISVHSILCVKLTELDSDCIHYFKRDINGMGDIWGLFITQVSNFVLFVLTGIYLIKQNMCPNRSVYDEIY